MPIFEEEGRLTREDLEQLRRKNKCLNCGERLDTFLDRDSGRIFLACHNWPTNPPFSHHEGIEREYQPQDTDSQSDLRRLVEMEEKVGLENTRALAKLPAHGQLTQTQAEHILGLVYPGVPKDEVIRCAILCRDFGLHPLMKEVYIIGFENKRTGKKDYSTVIGIAASRKMAADKKGAYSFLDGTPRAATSEEIIKQYGKDSEEERGNLISICKLKGEKGNEATGFGLWPKGKEPYGIDKGNTKRNMANIRSERPAYSRLPGAALPPLEVIDEAYAEVPDVGKVKIETGEVIEGGVIEDEARVIKDGLDYQAEHMEHWCREHNCPFELKSSRFGPFYAHKIKSGWCNEKKKKAEAEPGPEPESQLAQGAGGFLEEPEPEPEKPQRDPSTIRTLNNLFKACNEDFKLQPDQVIKELGVSSQTDIADTPADCYQKIAAVR